MIRSRFQKSGMSDFDSEDVNPMEGVANLSDAMLVLAVGIMLSLIIAWKVDISSVASAESVSPDGMVEIEENTEDITKSSNKDALTPEDYGLSEAGRAYRDEDGNLYILEE